jgi:hypothetical protein
VEPGTTRTAIARDPSGRWLMIEPTGWVPVDDLEVTGDVERLPVLDIHD